MIKFLSNHFFVLTTLVFLAGCAGNDLAVNPVPESDAGLSSLSFFNSFDPNYPKVHPKFYNKKYPVVVMAHRGFRDVAPENTMAAFRKAYQLGANMLETDVHMTKDRQLVLIHDNTLDRTTNGKGPVENLTLEELKKLDAGSFFSPVFKGEPIPTLEEFLQFAKGKISVNIEIKKDAVENQSQDGVEKKVVEMVEKYQMEEYAIICSFSEIALSRVKQINPNISTGLLVVSDGLFTSQVSRVSKVKADAIHEFGKFVFKGEIKKSHNYDIQQNTWTINDPHRMSELIDNGVDGLITDRPDLALRVLEEKFPTKK
jgi:glycerophosphoryl diester phosphodiesterase